MEYIYAAMLLNSAGQKIDEASVKKVMTAAGIKPNESRVRALVAALEGVDIDEAIEKAVPQVAPAVAAPSAGAPEEKKEEEKEEKQEEVSEEQAAEGLGALFG